MEINEIFAYTAGLIDGEGSILLSKLRPTEFRTPVISLTSTSFEFLSFLKLNYGGYICKQKTYKSHYKKLGFGKLLVELFYLFSKRSAHLY